MDVHSILNLLLVAAGTSVLGALTKILLSPAASNFVNALGAKAAAETEKLISEADATHNALLVAAIHAAMVYAENHEADILKEFNSKADYVETVIEEDPRFAHLNLPLDTVKHLIEQIFQAYFSNLPHKADLKPADVIGGGGPGTH